MNDIDEIIFGEDDGVETKTYTGAELMEKLGQLKQKEIPEGKAFYMIWCKDSTPKVQHLTQEEATRYATKAANAQQRPIYVMKAVALVTPTNEAHVADLF